MPWTQAQRQTIEARGGNLLVSAAAGSGKTAVLAERIVSLVREGKRIDELLVVTFTRAAAAEMRARILSSLHDADDGGGWLAMQALRVERADISTLHGFCAKVLREHFQAAGVDPTFRVGDTAELGVLRAGALEAAMTACFEAPTPAFERAAACYAQETLFDAVETLHTFLMARPEPWQWVEEAAQRLSTDQEALKDSLWMAVLLDRVCLEAEAAVDAFVGLQAYADEHQLYREFTAREAENARAFLDAARQGYAALTQYAPLDAGRKPSKKRDADEALEARYMALRKAAKAALKDAMDAAVKLHALEESVEDIRDTKQVFMGIAEAARRFHETYAGLKAERNLVDFHDLEHFALRALQSDAVAEGIRSRYAAVFIDEYQDSSLLQEAILQRVCRGDNLFMVGDVKQSIYRFRLAEPALFLRKTRTFSLDEGMVNRRIPLNANFRSEKTLLAAINQVFARVFCGGMMELPYDGEEWLTPGVEDGPEGMPVEVHLAIREAEGDEEEEETEEAEDAPTAGELSQRTLDAITYEAEMIAERIEALQREEGARLKDIAIVMRTVRGKAALVVEVLRQKGIAAWSDQGEDALLRPEVQAVVSLLAVIDNIRQDLPLLSALRGPALGLSEESLAAIRVAQPEGTFADAMFAYAAQEGDLAGALRGFMERIRAWALEAQVMPLDTFLRRLYEVTGHYAAVGALTGGASRQANLRMLAEHAGAYQRAQPGGVGGFLRYLERVKARDGIAAQDIGDGDDVVRVLSIHKSKGLQFPVVFVAGLGTRLDRRKDSGALLLHADLGAGLAHIDPEQRSIRETLAQAAILEKKRQEAKAEEARVLYVAMTRAKRRLILTGAPKKGDAERWAMREGPPPARAASMLDWVMPCAMANPAQWVVMRRAARTRQDAASEMNAKEALLQTIRSQGMPNMESAVARRLSWRAPVPSGVPLKQSVSAVVKAEAKQGEAEDTPLTLAALPKRPGYMEAGGLSAAERGDAIHAFLRLIPLETQDLAAACRSMVQRDLLSREQADALPLAVLGRFFEGPVWARVRSAEQVRREWPFNLRMRIGEERTLLQGVIDCCFVEEGQWVLLDYKTDRAEDPAPMIRRYAPQLALYAKALEEITGIRVRERILYLLYQERGYSL